MSSQLARDCLIEDLSLDDTLDEIDDKEFAIPAINGPMPTIESIFNEDDNDSLGSDLQLETNDTISGLNELTENSSISSFDSRGFVRKSSATHPPPQPLAESSATAKSQPSLDGTVIRHSQLKTISAQIKSADTQRINSGRPTVLAISTLYVAVGTSHGFILVFDLRQVMKSCLRADQNAGAVTAMSVKRDNSRLLSSYSGGTVNLWNLQSGELIKTYTDLHSPNNTVLHLKFTSDNNFGALSDTSGSVYMLDFRRKDIESQCIFSGSRGEVLVIEPLILPENLKGAELMSYNNLCLLSMATVTKVIALSLRPSISVHFTQILKGTKETLPLITWQFVMVQMAENSRVIDPVLTFARQSTIYFFQASLKNSKQVVFTPLMQIKVAYIIRSIVWLNSRTIVTIDKTEKMHVLDVKSAEELEVIGIEDIQQVFGSAYFMSIENGRNVSEAMFLSAPSACYHSICVSNATISNNSSSNLLILGTDSVHLFAIRSWTERIDLLLEDDKYTDALALCLSFYKNTSKAVIGLSGKKAEKREVIGQKLIDLINEYVNTTLTLLCPQKGNIEQLLEHYKNLIPNAIYYCLAVDNNNQMLVDLFDKFSDDLIAKNVFLNSLESYVVNGEIRNLSPIIAKELIVYYEDIKWFHTLESIVTHLEITSLDIHHVMTVCRKHLLFDAIIYIYSQAFDDYMSPFEELIRKLEIFVGNGQEWSDKDIELGNRLLAYISCLLKGQSYPNKQTIEVNKKSILVRDILSRITKPYDPNSQYNNPFEDKDYPNLRTLLHFNAKRFLNILFNAFEGFDTENSFLTDQKQKIVDILVHIMIEKQGFDEKEINCFYIFIAKLMSDKRNTVGLKNTLLDQIIESLFCWDDKESSEERESVLIELIQSDVGKSLDENDILKMATNSQFFKICEYVYVKNRNWGQIMCSYLKDSQRKVHVFAYMDQIITSPNVSSEEKHNFEESIYSNIANLVEIDYQKTAQFLLDYLDVNKFTQMIATLDSNRKLLYKLLYGILIYETIKTHKKDPSIGSIDLDSLPPKEQKKHRFLTDPTLQEKLIDCMSEFEPKLVYKTLKHYLKDYRPDVVLQMIKKYEITDATAYLLEIADKYEEAFKLLHTELDEKIIDFDGTNVDTFWSDIEIKMIFLINLCQRCSAKMTDSVMNEKHWLLLLESMQTINILVKSSSKEHPMKNDFSLKLKQLMNRLVTGINGTQNLTSIMQKYIENNGTGVDGGGQSEQLYNVRDLFAIVYENYNYEETLLQKTNSLLLREVHSDIKELTQAVHKGSANHLIICLVCGKDLKHNDINVILFDCKHSYHERCVTTDDGPVCYVCDPSALHHRSASKRPTNALNIDPIHSSGQTLKDSLKLTDSQLKTLQYLKNGQRIDSRANILNQLPNTRIRLASNELPAEQIYKLNLAPQWRPTSE